MSVSAERGECIFGHPWRQTLTYATVLMCRRMQLVQQLIKMIK
jgi:hypothetical protein